MIPALPALGPLTSCRAAVDIACGPTVFASVSPCSSPPSSWQDSGGFSQAWAGRCALAARTPSGLLLGRSGSEGAGSRGARLRPCASRYLELVAARPKRKSKRRRGGGGSSDEDDDWPMDGIGGGGGGGGSGGAGGGGWSGGDWSGWLGGHGDHGGYSGGEVYLNWALYEGGVLWLVLCGASLVHAAQFLLLGGVRSKAVPDQEPGQQAGLA